MQHLVRSLGAEYDSFLAHNSENGSTDINTFVDLYSVKSFTNEPSELQQFHGMRLEASQEFQQAVGNGFRMFYFWKRAYELMETYSKTHNVHYDVVVYLRADEIFYSDLKLPSLEQNCVYIPEGNDFLSGVNDQMALGNMDTMKKFMDVYPLIVKIYSETNIPFHPETYLSESIRIHGLDVKRFNLNYHLHAERRNM
jgi:hypothetical protein